MLCCARRAREKGRRKRGSGITGPGRGLWVETWFPDWLNEKPVNRPQPGASHVPPVAKDDCGIPHHRGILPSHLLQNPSGPGYFVWSSRVVFEFSKGLSMLWWLHTFPWLQFHYVPAAILHVPLLPSLLQAPDSHVLWPLTDVLGTACPKLRSWWDLRTLSPPFFPCWSLKPEKWDCCL